MLSTILAFASLGMASNCDAQDRSDSLAVLVAAVRYEASEAARINTEYYGDDPASTLLIELASEFELIPVQLRELRQCADVGTPSQRCELDVDEPVLNVQLIEVEEGRAEVAIGLHRNDERFGEAMGGRVLELRRHSGAWQIERVLRLFGS